MQRIITLKRLNLNDFNLNIIENNQKAHIFKLTKPELEILIRESLAALNPMGYELKNNSKDIKR